MSTVRGLTGAAAVLIAAATLAPGIGYAQTLETQGDVVFLTGGVGLEEREAIEEVAAAENMNLKLVFAEPGGPYVSGVSVTVQDAAGVVVLQAETNGPWLFARLPTGEYAIRAELRGLARESSIQVPGTGRTQLVIAFPDTPAQADS